MLKFYRILSVILLLFNGVGALYGGWLLMVDPTGSRLELSLKLLAHSGFTDYFFPGLILFFLNGLLSIKISVLTILKWRYYYKLIFLQGCILTGWIIIQVAIIGPVYSLQAILGCTGILLMIAGVLINTKMQSK